jgi:hypothetical protein
MVTPTKHAEMLKNHDAFMDLLPGFLPDRQGQYALMRGGQIVAWFANPREALLSGRAKFSDDLFSVQEARSAKVDFGWFSRAPFDPAL